MAANIPVHQGVALAARPHPLLVLRRVMAELLSSSRSALGLALLAMAAVLAVVVR
jgi:hypothetical protein